MNLCIMASKETYQSHNNVYFVRYEGQCCVKLADAMFLFLFSIHCRHIIVSKK